MDSPGLKTSDVPAGGVEDAQGGWEERGDEKRKDEELVSPLFLF